MHHISIIVVNYNSAQLTTACLKSLAHSKLKGARFSVIVVDNGSSIPYKLPSSYNHFVTVIRSGANLGFTGGNNLGIHEAIEENNSDFVVLLNNDATVAEDCIQKMLDKAVANEECGLVSPKIYFTAGREYHEQSYGNNQQGKVLWFAGGSIDWQNLLAFHRGVDEVDRGQMSATDAVDFATGCCVLIKREVLEKIGLLDKRYFLYFEDVELSMKAQSFGYKLLFCPEAVAWHDNAGSSDGAGSVTHQYYQTRNRLLFFWEYGSLKTKSTILKLLLRLLVSKNKMERIASQHFVRRQFGKQPIL